MNFDKNSIRNHVKKKRTTLNRDQISALDLKITQRCKQYLSVLEEQCISCFWGSHKLGEIQTNEILESILDQGHILCLPKMEASNSMRMLKVESLSDLVESQYGIFEPKDNADECTPDLVITPLLAADIKGYRIGYGKGYYDRYFSKHLQAIRVGLVYEIFIFNKLPINKYDIPLDALITEKRYLKF